MAVFGFDDFLTKDYSQYSAWYDTTLADRLKFQSLVSVVSPTVTPKLTASQYAGYQQIVAEEKQFGLVKGNIYTFDDRNPQQVYFQFTGNANDWNSVYNPQNYHVTYWGSTPEGTKALTYYAQEAHSARTYITSTVIFLGSFVASMGLAEWLAPVAPLANGATGSGSVGAVGVGVQATPTTFGPLTFSAGEVGSGVLANPATFTIGDTIAYSGLPVTGLSPLASESIFTQISNSIGETGAKSLQQAAQGNVVGRLAQFVHDAFGNIGDAITQFLTGDIAGGIQRLVNPPPTQNPGVTQFPQYYSYGGGSDSGNQGFNNQVQVAQTTQWALWGFLIFLILLVGARLRK
jgi:hypothetical protein